jgi:hypothetical protein
VLTMANLVWFWDVCGDVLVQGAQSSRADF